MSKYILLLSFCLLSACAKDVDKKESPMGDNGGVPPVTDGAQNFPLNYSFEFANHASQTDIYPIYSKYDVKENIEIVLPQEISPNFERNRFPQYLYLKLNNQDICRYVLVNRKYVAYSTCPEHLKLYKNDILLITDIPNGKVVGIKFSYRHL